MTAERATRAQGSALLRRYETVRGFTETLCASLSAEDQCVQSMPDASPAKWHRAHSSWFFEQFLLRPHAPGYTVFHDDFCYLFNSYYEAVGARHPRPQRGLLTRPSAAAVGEYRAHVDAAMGRWLGDNEPGAALAGLIELGLQHEQQHQELLLTDMMHAFAQSPLYPAVLPGWMEPEGAPEPTRFVGFRGGIAGLGSPSLGADGDSFSFDNETPRHQVLLQPYQLASRLVRNGEYRDFMADGGYRRPELWMAEGWDRVRQEGWDSPLYWRRDDDTASAHWQQFGPGGLGPLNDASPVRHISWYEADAFARWAGARLPTEAELETAQGQVAEFTGHVWQWTASAYLPYPGFRAAPGAVGEYNGKFMINQMVLRGGSLATPPGHARSTYRNFFHPDRRWQFTGLRLAKD
jgi:ergothioneine biosynthesis protein EgtB